LTDRAPGAIPVLINATAGTGHAEAECDALKGLFREAGGEARIIPARTGAELLEQARALARDHPPVIVAGGGDGTVSAVAGVIAGTQTALGVLPLGTLNHFAKDLHSPLDRLEAARTIVAGHHASVDVGEVNGRVFINNSSLGLYPQIVLERQMQQRQLGRAKWVALFWATLSVVRRGAYLQVRVRAEGEQRDYPAPLVFIGANEYVMEGLEAGTRERLDGGLLSIYITHHTHRWGLVGLALRALFGRLQQARDFEALTAETAEISTRRKRIHVATDGEVTMMDTPLRYRIRPLDLRVIVPAPETRPGEA
jgi:diacylglycerol kinase family enzyme